MTEIEKTCATCFESANDCIPFECGHIMHPDCIKEHLAKLECPLCRASLEGSLSEEVKRHITTRYQEVRRQEADEELSNIVDEIIRTDAQMLSTLLQPVPVEASTFFTFAERILPTHPFAPLMLGAPLFPTLLSHSPSQSSFAGLTFNFPSSTRSEIQQSPTVRRIVVSDSIEDLFGSIIPPREDSDRELNRRAFLESIAEIANYALMDGDDEASI